MTPTTIIIGRNGPDTADPFRRTGHRPPMTWARHLRHLSYASFRHAQGNQAVQVHFVQSYLRAVLEHGTPGTLSPLERILDRARRLAVPAGHLPVDRALSRAQFLFWSHNIWDIARSLVEHDPAVLPNRGLLDARAADVGAAPGMSSFNEPELAELAGAFEIYRTGVATTWAAAEVIDKLFVPQLLEVELGFQGLGARYPRRPRTDGGDKHESRMLGHCRTAHTRFARGKASITDVVYRQVCRRLDQLCGSTAAGTAVAGRYDLLIQLYNQRHPGSFVSLLHVPENDFARKPGDPVESQGHDPSA